jgi:hypothetical protein
MGMMSKKKDEILKETSEAEAPEVNVSSPFFLSFFGQRVKVLTNIFQSFSVNTAEGIAQESLPISIMGYILDADDQYYYIGATPHEIRQAIKKDSVSVIEVFTEEDEKAEVFDKILEQAGGMKTQ